MTLEGALLAGALEIISDEKRWVRGVGAVDRGGRPVKTTDPGAVAWCAVGALDCVAGSENELFEASLAILAKASLQLFGCDPVEVNDRLGHSEVLQMYARAIQLARRSGAQGVNFKDVIQRRRRGRTPRPDGGRENQVELRLVPKSEFPHDSP